MQIGILGAGNVGSSLGTALAARGHSICFGVRDPGAGHVRAVVAACMGKARAGSLQQAADFGEVVILAVSTAAIPAVLGQLHGLEGKILVDATNRMAPGSPGTPASAVEEVAALAPGARLVKAFNTIGAEHLRNPRFGAEPASMFLAGDNPQAKEAVASLAANLGFDPVDAGGLRNAPLLEGLARLWVAMARAGDREIAFRLLRR